VRYGSAGRNDPVSRSMWTAGILTRSTGRFLIDRSTLILLSHMMTDRGCCEYNLIQLHPVM
jgi:hypothetical protein